MSLKYEPASEPLQISEEDLNREVVPEGGLVIAEHEHTRRDSLPIAHRLHSTSSLIVMKMNQKNGILAFVKLSEDPTGVSRS